MPGAIIFVIAMVLVIPVAVMFGGAIWTALLGWLLVEDTEPPTDSEPASP
jgi:hypothetical protein